ncbi:MAG: hypothetical protein WBY88_18250, partial [Desulfosarcina sp.]
LQGRDGHEPLNIFDVFLQVFGLDHGTSRSEGGCRMALNGNILVRPPYECQMTNEKRLYAAVLKWP